MKLPKRRRTQSLLYRRTCHRSQTTSPNARRRLQISSPRRLRQIPGNPFISELVGKQKRLIKSSGWRSVASAPNASLYTVVRLQLSHENRITHCICPLGGQKCIASALVWVVGVECGDEASTLDKEARGLRCQRYRRAQRVGMGRRRRRRFAPRLSRRSRSSARQKSTDREHASRKQELPSGWSGSKSAAKWPDSEGFRGKQLGVEQIDISPRAGSMSRSPRNCS